MAIEVLRLPTVILKTKLARSSIYRLEAAGKFPKRVQLCEGGKAVGWYSHEIEEYLANLQRVADTPCSHEGYHVRRQHSPALNHTKPK